MTDEERMWLGVITKLNGSNPNSSLSSTTPVLHLASSEQ